MPFGLDSIGVAEEMTDEDIVARVRGGDEGALTEFVRRFSPQALSYAARMTGDLAAAEDIGTSVLVRTVKRLREFEPAAGPFSFFFLPILMDGVMKHFSSEEHGKPKRPLVRKLVRPDVRKLYEAFLELEPVYRQVVCLRLLMQLSYAEVARVAGVPIQTVRSQMEFALDRMMASVSTGWASG